MMMVFTHCYNSSAGLKIEGIIQILNFKRTNFGGSIVLELSFMWNFAYFDTQCGNQNMLDRVYNVIGIELKLVLDSHQGRESLV